MARPERKVFIFEGDSETVVVNALNIDEAKMLAIFVLSPEEDSKSLSLARKFVREVKPRVTDRSIALRFATSVVYDTLCP